MWMQTRAIFFLYMLNATFAFFSFFLTTWAVNLEVYVSHELSLLQVGSRMAPGKQQM